MVGILAASPVIAGWDSIQARRDVAATGASSCSAATNEPDREENARRARACEAFVGRCLRAKRALWERSDRSSEPPTTPGILARSPPPGARCFCPRPRPMLLARPVLIRGLGARRDPGAWERPGVVSRGRHTKTLAARAGRSPASASFGGGGRARCMSSEARMHWGGSGPRSGPDQRYSAPRRLALSHGAQGARVAATGGRVQARFGGAPAAQGAWRRSGGRCARTRSPTSRRSPGACARWRSRTGARSSPRSRSGS